MAKCDKFKLKRKRAFENTVELFESDKCSFP